MARRLTVLGRTKLSPAVGTSGSAGQGLHGHFWSSTMVKARKRVVGNRERRESVG